MEAQYTDEELRQLLQGFDLPLNPDNAGFDPTVFATDFGQTSSLAYFPPLPPIEESSGGENTEVKSDHVEIQDMQKRVEVLESEIESFKSTVKYLKSYLNNLHRWTEEVSEALDKLGEAPASATSLEFTEDRLNTRV